MITLTSYNPDWPKQFVREKALLEKSLADIVPRIEHIGSTAIPGIYAKPVIDILIGVDDLAQFTQAHITAIESLGYVYISEYEQHLPHRRFFQKENANGQRTYHIHLVNYPSAWWQRHILFRDYLRKHLQSAKQYETLKLHCAKTINANNGLNTKTLSTEGLAEFNQLKQALGGSISLGNQYALAKTEFVKKINQQAYFDFTIHQASTSLNRINGYIPQQACLEQYINMFQDADFVKCYTVKFSDEQIKNLLVRNENYWDQYRFGPYTWFDNKTQAFVGQGGLKHTTVEGEVVIELVYALKKQYWGQGLAVEIGQFAIDQAFKQLKVDNIVCFTHVSNKQSQRVIEKLGFCYEKDFNHKSLPHKFYRLT